MKNNNIFNSLFHDNKARVPNISFQSVVNDINDDVYYHFASIISLLSDFVINIKKLPITIQCIMGINVIIYCMWQYHDKKNSKFMLRHFTLSKENDKSRKWTTWIMSHFSHRTLSHLLMNLFTFSVSGPLTLKLIGIKKFISFLGITSLVSSFASSIIRDKNTVSLGMSAVTSALAIFDANANPTSLFKGYDLSPYSVINYSQVLQSIILADIIGFFLSYVLNINTGIDHGMHVIGYSIGFVYINFICSKNGSRYFTNNCRSRLCQ